MLGKKNILLVEDDCIIGMQFREMFEDFGYEVENIVAWGDEATALIKKSVFDLIIMDIRLEGNIDGITAAETARQFSNVPIIFMSGYTDIQTIEKVRKIDNSRLFTKPVDPAQIKEALADFLED